MKESHRKFLSMFLCLALWFSFFTSIRNDFVSAQPIEVFFIEPNDGDTVKPNENGTVLIKAEYTGSECPHYMDFWIDGERKAHIHSYSPCTTSIGYNWPTLDYGDRWCSIYVCVTYQGGTVIAESEEIEVYLDNPDNPQIRIIDPLNNETVNGSVDITAKVKVDSTWVYDTKVKFTIGGNLIDWVFNPTGQENYYTFYYTLFNWDSSSVPDGEYTVSARVYDEFGREREDSIIIIVQQSIDNSPTVLITYPHEGDTVELTERIKISASDDIGVSKVELKVDNQLIHTFYSEPYEYYWDTTAYSDGQHAIEAIVYDTSDQCDSHSINVWVKNADSPPIISITNPQNNDTVNGKIRIDVTASDDIGVTKVEFYIDNILVGTDTSEPYLDWWDTATYSEGIHTIRTVAYDTKNQTDSDEIIVNVQNETPNQPPTACFTYDPLNLNIGQTVSFDASCSSDLDGDSLTYSWNFGDGNNGTGKNVSHSYSLSGSYQVTLTVNDGNGGIDSISKTLEVNQSGQFSLTISALSMVLADGKSSEISIDVSISTTVEVKVLPTPIFGIAESDPDSIYNLGDEGLPILDGNKSKWEGYILENYWDAFSENYWDAFSENDFGYFDVNWKKDEKSGHSKGYEIPEGIMSAKKQAFQIAFNHLEGLYKEYNISYLLILGPYEVFPSYLVQAYLDEHYHNIFSDTVLVDFEGSSGHISNYLDWAHDFKAEVAVGRIVAYTFEEYSYILGNIRENKKDVEEGLFLNTKYTLDGNSDYYQEDLYAEINKVLADYDCGTTMLKEDINWGGTLKEAMQYICRSDLVFVGDHGSPQSVHPFWFPNIPIWKNFYGVDFDFNCNILFVCAGCSVGKFNTLYDGEHAGLLSPTFSDSFLTYKGIHTLLLHNGIGFFAPSCYSYPGSGNEMFGSEYLMFDLIKRIPDYRVGEAFIQAKRNYIENVEFWWFFDIHAKKKAIVVASYNFFGNPKMRFVFSKKNENQLENNNQFEKINRQMQPLASTNVSKVESLQKQAKQLLQQALNKELDVLEAQVLIEKADELLADAREQYLSGNYVAANNLALEAINLYQQAIEILQALLA